MDVMLCTKIISTGLFIVCSQPANNEQVLNAYYEQRGNGPDTSWVFVHEGDPDWDKALATLRIPDVKK